MADRSKWADETAGVVLLLPYLGAFVPGYQEVVERGVTILHTLPEWYQVGAGIGLAWAFGVNVARAPLEKLIGRKIGL